MVGFNYFVLLIFVHQLFWHDLLIAAPNEKPESVTHPATLPLEACEVGLRIPGEGVDPLDFKVVTALIANDIARTYTLKKISAEALAPILVPILGHSTSGLALASRLTRKYRTWTGVFTGLGLTKPNDKITTWSRELIIDSILAVAPFSELNQISIKKLSGEGLAALRAVTNNPTMKGASLSAAPDSTKEFDTWDDAVKAARAKMETLAAAEENSGEASSDSNPIWRNPIAVSRLRNHRIRLSWSDSDFADSMTAIVNAYQKNPNAVRINAKAMVDNDSPEATAALQAVMGPRATTNALIQRIRGHGGTWDIALQMCGVDPKEVRLQEEVVKWSKKKIIIFLQALYDEGFDLRFESVRLDRTPRFEALSMKLLGQKVWGSALIHAISTRYAHYTEAVREAGLPYGLMVQISGFTKNRLSELPVRQNHEDLSMWRRQLQSYLPEEAIHSFIEMYEATKVQVPEHFVENIMIPYLRFWQKLLGQRGFDNNAPFLASHEVVAVILEQGAQLFLLDENAISILERTFEVTAFSALLLRDRFLEGRMVVILALKQLSLNSIRSATSGTGTRFYTERLTPRVLRSPNALHEAVYRMMSYF